MILKNAEILRKGAAAEIELANIYRKINEILKDFKEKKKYKWVMKMLERKYTADRTFWNIPVKVDYVLEKFDFKKTEVSKSFEGKYRGEIVIRIENMHDFDSQFPQSNAAYSIENHLKPIYSLLPNGTSTKFVFEANQPTKYTQRIRFTNVEIYVKYGSTGFNATNRSEDKLKFLFDYTMLARGFWEMTFDRLAKLNLVFHDDFTVKTEDPNCVFVKAIDGKIEYFVLSVGGKTQGEGSGFFAEYGKKINMGKNNFLELVKNGMYIMVYPNSAEGRAINYKSIKYQ
jgi:hypothetical protein